MTPAQPQPADVGPFTPRELSSSDPEPSVGAVVWTDGWGVWQRLGAGRRSWFCLTHDDDSESWTRVAGNYGPVTLFAVAGSEFISDEPDPRDAALTAARALHAEDDDHCQHCLWQWPCHTARALDGVAPVPAPPAPTPTGWTAEEQAVRVGAAAHLLRGADTSGPFVRGLAARALDVADAAVLALRAEEAAAAAPATTDADRADAARRAYWNGQGASPQPWSQVGVASRASWRAAVRAADDAHRAAGSPPPARSDLGGLAAREAGA